MFFSARSLLFTHAFSPETQGTPCGGKGMCWASIGDFQNLCFFAPNAAKPSISWNGDPFLCTRPARLRISMPFIMLTMRTTFAHESDSATVAQ